MSIAVPVILAILFSAQIYNIYGGLPNYSSEPKDKSEQADESSSDKDKSEAADKSSSEKDKAGKVGKSASATASKGRRHPHTERHD